MTMVPNGLLSNALSSTLLSMRFGYFWQLDDFFQAHLLLAQVYVKQEKAKLAMQCLDQALSHSFEVRDSVLYHFIKSKTHELLGEYEDALKILEAALQLSSMKNLQTSIDFDKSHSNPSRSVQLYDRVAIFLQLASVYYKLFQPVNST